MLFGSRTEGRFSFKDEGWRDDTDLSAMEKDVSKEEIKKAVWELGMDRAPGLDDFSIFFFLEFWDVVKRTF